VWGLETDDRHDSGRWETFPLRGCGPADEYDYGQLTRRAAFRAEHPEFTIGPVGGKAQATVPLDGDGSLTITRDTWRELLDELDAPAVDGGPG
jgi:hypothetical protein